MSSSARCVVLSLLGLVVWPAPAAAQPAGRDAPVTRSVLKPTPPPPPADAPVSSPAPASPSRAARFLGAFIGSSAITGAAMVSLTVRGPACGVAPGACARDVDGLDYAAGLSWPIFSLLAGAGGAAIAGEPFPGGASFFGTLLGMSFTSLTWFSAQALWLRDASTPMTPFIALASPLVGAGTALAVDYRGEQLARARWSGVDVSVRTSRVVVSGIGSLATTAAVAVAVGVGGRSLCGTTTASNSPVPCFAALAAPALLLPALTAWAIHRAFGGRGTFLASVLGMALAAFATASTILASNFSQGSPRGPADFFWPGLGGMAMGLPAAFLGAPFALEASHADVLLDEDDAATARLPSPRPSPQGEREKSVPTTSSTSAAAPQPDCGSSFGPP